MPRRQIRLTALILAVLFFATSAKEVFGVACPHHDLAIPGATSEKHGVAHAEYHPAEAVPGGGHGHHSHGHASDHQEIDPAADQPETHAGVCTCLDDCNGTAVTEPPSAASQRLIALATRAVAAVPVTGAEFTTPIPYLLPFATAPPLGR